MPHEREGRINTSCSLMAKVLKRRLSNCRFAAFVPILTAVLFSFVTSARAGTSSPIGQWYLNANGFALSVNISSPLPGVYSGTIINESGGTETVDNITWDASTRLLKLRRVGTGFWQWYAGTIVEGIWVGRFAHSDTSPLEPADPVSFAWHVTAWNSNYLDTAIVPRVWEIFINNSDRARLRIDQGTSGLVGRLKVYSTVADAANGEQLEFDLDSIAWDGNTLSFTQHLNGTATRTYQASVTGRTIQGTYAPGAGSFAGTRAAVLTYGVAPKSAAVRQQWADRTRLQLNHLMMADNPQPLSVTVTALNLAGPPTTSVALPPDRDDNPAAWPQEYSVTELQFDSTLPNPYGGAPIARASHGYLAVPKGAPPAGGKYPALLAVNGHGGSAWKMLNPDDSYFWYGDAFARRGFIVLALDISHRPLVDRANLYGDYLTGDDPDHGNNTHPAVKAPGFDSDWEENGERAWDTMRALDYLTSLPQVDASRVVISGLSLGGEVTAITAGLDPRFAMSIPAGYSPDEGVMLYYGAHPCWQWQHADVREYADISDFFALTAPRPLLIETGKVDYTFSPRTPPFSADKQVARRTLAAYNADAALFNLYLHYDQHHYHVGDANPTAFTERGVRIPDLLAPGQPWSTDWQTSAATHSIQPSLFDWIAAPGTVVPADFALAATPGTSTIAAGQSASYSLTITPSGAFSDPLSFSCTNLPAQAVCSSSPASLRPDGISDAAATITISTTAQSAARFKGFGPGEQTPLAGSNRISIAFWLSLQLAVSIAFFSGGTAWRRATPRLALILLFGLLGISCGGGGTTVAGTSGTPAGTYSVGIVAASGNLQHSTTVTLKVN
jgi:dienelactone hydrolase